MRTSRTRRPTFQLALAIPAAAALVAGACDDQRPMGPAPASGQDRDAVVAASMHAPPPILVETLTGRHEFIDDVAMQFRVKRGRGPTTVINISDPSNLAVARFTVQPGARFPWHTHPGLVIVAVTQGELVYVDADDCVPRSYDEKAFIDPGFGHTHTAYNPSTSQETVVVATFIGVPPTGPLSLAVSAEQQAALDAACNIPGLIGNL